VIVSFGQFMKITEIRIPNFWAPSSTVKYALIVTKMYLGRFFHKLICQLQEYFRGGVGWEVLLFLNNPNSCRTTQRVINPSQGSFEEIGGYGS
jgi:hypothetical protein